MNQPKWITDRMPEQYDTVLVRISSESWPIGMAVFMSSQWRWDNDEMNLLERPVLGWMSLQDAAAILDAPSNADLAESLK